MLKCDKQIIDRYTAVAQHILHSLRKYIYIYTKIIFKFKIVK